MPRSVLRIKGLGFILWHARHELYHVALGLVWAWFLREWWNEFNIRWIGIAVVASLLPDLDHVLYFYTYGKKETYATQLRQLLKTRQWRNLTMFLENGHKQNTNLATHNIYVIGFFLACAALSSFIEWRVGVIMFGAMVIHYIFDIFDDLLFLGKLNPNWKRFRRMRSSL